MNHYKHIQHAIKKKAAPALKDLLKSHPQCLSSPSDGCCESDRETMRPWEVINKKEWQRQKNDFLTLQILLDCCEDNNDILQTVIEHNPSTLQFHDPWSERSLLSELIKKNNDDFLWRLFNTYPQYTINYSS